MAAYYSVVKFVPDPIANEAINIGIIAASGNRIEVRKLADWDRVKRFAGTHWREARRLIAELEEDPKSFLGLERVGSVDQMRLTLSAWTRALQFSEVRGSLETLDELMATIEPMVLAGQRVGMLAPQSRRVVVVRSVSRAMSSAFELRFERTARGLLQHGARVTGARTQHKMDVGFVNGSLYAGAFALTFTTGQQDRQWKDTDAVAFAIEDIRGAGTNAPLAIVIDAPENGSEASHRANNVLGGLGAELLSLDQVPDWARRAAAAVPDAVVNH